MEMLTPGGCGDGSERKKENRDKKRVRKEKSGECEVSGKRQVKCMRMPRGWEVRHTCRKQEREKLLLRCVGMQFLGCTHQNAHMATTSPPRPRNFDSLPQPAA